MTRPCPGTSTRDTLPRGGSSARSRSSTVFAPSNSNATTPTGVSSACVPAPIRPRCAERDGHADRAVPAHAEVADVVEEDDARAQSAHRRLAQQRPDQHVGAARLVDDGAAEASRCSSREPLAPLGQTCRRPGPARRRSRRASARRRCANRRPECGGARASDSRVTGGCATGSAADDRQNPLRAPRPPAAAAARASFRCPCRTRPSPA